MKRVSIIILLCLAVLALPAQKREKTKPVRLPDKLTGELSYIPAKTFTSLAHQGSDSIYQYRSRISSVNAFYIGKTEVTNREYREFAFYVRDSIAHFLLGQLTADNKIDWTRSIDWNDKRLDKLMIAGEFKLRGTREINPAQLNYTVDFFGKQQNISIYPDTLVWMRDFTYSYNEVLVKKYFSHADYDNYPVVGINLKQAMAFCQWKSLQLQMEFSHATETRVKVRLPSNAEWESAAFETKDTTFIEAKRNSYHYNFGNIVDGSRVTIKTYKDDGHFYTAPVKSYRKGPYGLYDMKGNVAEWTITPLEEVMNAEMKEERSKAIFVVKGGSWNSTPFYLQAGVCQFLNADAMHCYTGFRYIVELQNSK